MAENFRRFCSAAGADPAALVKNHQVHGDLVRPVTRRDVMSSSAEPGVYEADGLITDEPGLCLTIFSADCIPVLLLDPVRRCAAAVHAGWRGPPWASQPGPPSGCGRTTAAARNISGPPSGLGSPPAAFDPRRRAWCPPGWAGQSGGDLHTPGGGRALARGPEGANALWLRRAGLSPEHIALCPDCTACRTDRFWSHRVMGGRRGSMAAIIQLL